MSLIDWKYMLTKTHEESKLGHGNQRPKIKPAWAFMPVLITSNFDDDLIKNERASMEITSFPLRWIRYHQHNIFLVYI